MTADTHRLGGIAVGSTLFVLFNDSVAQAATVLAFSYLGSLFPDIDTRTSSISYKMPITSCMITIIQKLIRFLTLFLPKPVRKKVRTSIGHRGIFHSFFGILLCGLGICLGLNYLHLTALSVAGGLGMICGMLSHIVLDLFSGYVPLMLPFTTKKTSLGDIKTDGLVERILKFIILASFSVISVFLIIDKGGSLWGI